MKMKELFDRGEFAVSAEVGPPKGIHVDELVEEAKTYLKGVHAVNVTDNQNNRKNDGIEKGIPEASPYIRILKNSSIAFQRPVLHIQGNANAVPHRRIHDRTEQNVSNRYNNQNRQQDQEQISAPCNNFILCNRTFLFVIHYGSSYNPSPSFSLETT